jgi:Fe-S-cluster containining protein
MSQSESKIFDKYLKIRQEIDKFAGQLSKIHHKHITCKKGCDSCCTDYGILPVEFHFILNELKHIRVETQLAEAANESKCIFLKNHACTIYEQRPVICRTHGLPLIFANDEGEFELSACELNFTNFDFDDFSMENTFHQDKYNSKLFMLNREFLMEGNHPQFGEFDLIPLKEIALKNNT